MKPTVCEHCGATSHQPYEDGLVECRNNLRDQRDYARDLSDAMVDEERNGCAHIADRTDQSAWDELLAAARAYAVRQLIGMNMCAFPTPEEQRLGAAAIGYAATQLSKPGRATRSTSKAKTRTRSTSKAKTRKLSKGSGQ